MLMTGMLKSQSNGLKLVMLLNDRIESWREATEVKVVSFLKRVNPSPSSGMLSNCEKMVSLIAPVIDCSIHVYIALQLCTALSFVRDAPAAVISASVTE